MPRGAFCRLPAALTAAAAVATHGEIPGGGSRLSGPRGPAARVQAPAPLNVLDDEPQHDDRGWPETAPTALLVLADGTVLEGSGFGATGHAVGEVCFNTAMTGYQEILTDPSYAGQIITFTFPHIGNVGANDEDIETLNLAATPGARGVILHSRITGPSNYRARRHLDHWLKARGIIGLAGIDTRALTSLIRSRGMPNAVIAHAADGAFRPRRPRGARPARGRASSAWTSCRW